MLFRNDGKGENNTVQNRFTAYVVRAVQRRKAAVLGQRNQVSQHEFSADLRGDLIWMQSPGTGCSDLEVRFEIAAFERALNRLSDRDRYIIVSRLLHERDFSELAEELDLGYKGVTAVYYRAIQKIRKELQGDES